MLADSERTKHARLMVLPCQPQEARIVRGTTSLSSIVDAVYDLIATGATEEAGSVEVGVAPSNFAVTVVAARAALGMCCPPLVCLGSEELPDMFYIIGCNH